VGGRLTRASNTTTFAKEPHPLRKFSNQIFSIRGRSNRAKFWLAYLVACGQFVFAAVVIKVGGGPPSSTPILLVACAFGLLGIVLALLATIRRLHDRSRSGHWFWLFCLLPGAMEAFANALAGQDLTSRVLVAWIYLLAAGFSIWGFVEIVCLPGTAGPNRYGPDPLQDKQSLAAASPR